MTSWSLGNSGPEAGSAGSLLAPPGQPQNIFSILSLKTVKNTTINMNHFVCICGIQNRQSGCYRSLPSVASIKGGIRQEAEQLILRQQWGGGL